MEFEVIVKGKYGLHARPALKFVEIAKSFSSAITLVKEDRQVDCKSMISVISAGISPGTHVRIIAEGTDEEQAIAAMKAFFNDQQD
jgi:phosphocarrier protein